MPPYCDEAAISGFIRLCLSGPISVAAASGVRMDKTHEDDRRRQPARATTGVTGRSDDTARLSLIGLDDARRAEVRRRHREVAKVSRVIRMDRGWATLQTATESVRVPLRECPPIVVGDWLVDGPDGLERLERRSLLMRRAVSERIEPQLMAANIDLVIVTWALDSRVRSNRLKELILMARDSGAEVLVLLTKQDLFPRSVAILKSEVAEVLEGVEVRALDARSEDAIEMIRPLVANRTIVFLGASGAGKSTLTNLLLEDHDQETAAVGRTGEGRHTTTSRQLFAIDGGGAIIDSPGIRDVTVWGEGEGLKASFPELDELAEQCRFSDCTHRSIDGCALSLAVAEGVVSAGRRDQYLEFLEEQRSLDAEREALERKITRAKNRRRSV